MKKEFENITEITEQKMYDLATAYVERLIKKATTCGALEQPDADNEYTREIGRVGKMCGIYENTFMKFKHIKVKTPLQLAIWKEMHRKNLKQRQMAEMLNIKESTFSQILSGRRTVSMAIAKKLYNDFHISAKTILGDA